jgi:hypothetical protein
MSWLLPDDLISKSKSIESVKDVILLNQGEDQT